MRLAILLICLCLVFTPITPVEGQPPAAEISLQCQTSGIFFYNETTVKDGIAQNISCSITNPTSYREKISYTFQNNAYYSNHDPPSYIEPETTMSFYFGYIGTGASNESWPIVLKYWACVEAIGESDLPPVNGACSKFEYTFHRSANDYFWLDKNESQILTIDANSVQSKERYRTEETGSIESSANSTSFWDYYGNFFHWNYFEFCEDFFESYQMRCQNTYDESFHLTGIQDSEGVRQEINTSSWAELSNGTRLLTLETSFLVNSKLMENGINYCEQCDETVNLTLEIYYIPLDEGLNIPKSVIIVGLMVVVSSIILLGINMKNKKSEEMNENEFTDENMGEILNDTEVIAKDDSVIETIQSQEESLERTMVNDEHTVDIDESDLSANRLSKFQLQLLIGVMIGVSIISAFLLFTERGFFEISRFDWLSANCDDFAKNWSMHDTFLYQGDEYYNDVYEQCHEEKFASIINSLILIGSVSTAVISSYFLQKASSENNNSSKIETTSIKDSTTTETHEQSSVDSSANGEKSSNDSVNKKADSDNMIKQQDLDEFDKIEKPEKPIKKPTNTTQISPLSPIEFDTEGYEWSTDRFERPIYRIAGSADHWEIWEQ